MALVPCNVCGTLNSDEAEICLSCEYPIKGRRRSAFNQWVALVLLALFAAPLFALLLNWFNRAHQSEPATQSSLIRLSDQLPNA